MIAKWNRVFGAGHASAPRTIRFTALGDPESWPAANTVAAILGDATSAIDGRDYIFQLGHLGDSVFVGNRNSIGRILYTGDATTPFRYNQLADFGIEGPHNYVPSAAAATSSPAGASTTSGPRTFSSPTSRRSSAAGASARRSPTCDKHALIYSVGTAHYTRDGNLLVFWHIIWLGQTLSLTHVIVHGCDRRAGERAVRALGRLRRSATSRELRNATTKQEELLYGTDDGELWHLDDGNYAWWPAAPARPSSPKPSPGGRTSASRREKKNFRDLYVEVGQRGGFSLGIDVYYDYGRSPGLALAEPSYTPAAAFWGAPATWGTSYVWATRGIARNYYLGVDDGVVLSFGFRNNVVDQAWALYKAVPAVEAVGEGQETD